MTVYIPELQTCTCTGALASLKRPCCSTLLPTRQSWLSHRSSCAKTQALCCHLHTAWFLLAARGSSKYATQRGRPTCRAGLGEGEIDEESGWVAKNQDKLRGAPLVAGGLGITGVVLNRTVSGAVGLDASSVESRTDVIIILMSAVLLLTGLQWLALKPVVKEAVEMDGEPVEYRHPFLPAEADRELTWAWRALQWSTRCRGLMAFYRGDCIAQFGLRNPGSRPQEARIGIISEKAIQSGRGNYLANLALYPGRVEFTGNFPVNTQGVVIQPIGQDGVLLAATDTQRGFGRLDQAWISVLAEKLDSTLEGYVPSGRGFGKQTAGTRS